MHTFKLEEMLLLSRSEKRARKLQFHPVATVIRGENHTGKSALIKSILFGFGVTPPEIDDEWRAAAVSSLIRFAIDDKRYAIYRHGNSFTLFADQYVPLGTFNSITNELAPELARILDFNLTLEQKNGETRIATPAFFFLPFYLDQDQGWVNNWNSFTGLSQFKDWRKDCVYYHTGIRPNEWYRLKAKVRELTAERDEPCRQERMLREVIHRLRSRLVNPGFDLDVNHFKSQIDRLLSRCQELRKAEENYKTKLIELETDRIRVDAQIEIVIRAQEELHLDYRYTVDVINGHVDCPACGASYENSFAEKFGIAQDEGRCIDLRQQLQQELCEIEEKIGSHRNSLSQTSKELNEVQSLLAEKQGDVTLKTLIESHGKREASTMIQDDLNAVSDQLGKIDAEIRSVQEQLKKLDDRERTERIISDYRARLREFSELLNVRSGSARIDSRIKGGGSERPRAVLAYFLAILRVLQTHGSYERFPMIIDAPDQQEQDRGHYQNMLKVIKDRRPAESQLVLGLVYDEDIDFGGSVLEMKEQHSALSAADYSAVESDIKPYAAASLITR